MRGLIDIKVATNKIKYQMQLSHGITIICGGSGTGKTTLCNLITRKSNKQGAYIDFTVTNGYPCRHLTNEMCEAGMLKTINNSIVFFDEDCDYVFSSDFAESLAGTTNYFVIITRHLKGLAKLPIDIEAICHFEHHNGVNSLVKTYVLNDDSTMFTGANFIPDYIVSEDSKSGYKFFRALYKEKCLPAAGNSKFETAVAGIQGADENILLVFDGSAIGCEINNLVLLRLSSLHKIAFFIPRSFEEFLLHSKIFWGLKELPRMLESPWDYADFSLYKSFEIFFTSLLQELTAKQGFSYTKTGPLAKIFTSSENVHILLSRITHITFTSSIF